MIDAEEIESRRVNLSHDAKKIPRRNLIRCGGIFGCVRHRKYHADYSIAPCEQPAAFDLALAFHVGTHFRENVATDSNGRLHEPDVISGIAV